jgi:hypothetical protein
MFKHSSFSRSGLLFALFCVPVISLLAQTPTPVTVPTWRYDLTGAGQNTSETALAPSNVNGSTFGKLFSAPVDGLVYAQPLYIPGLRMIDGMVHNVVFVATGQDSIYAFDADSDTGANAQPIWRITLLDAAHGAVAGSKIVPLTDTGSTDISAIGITGTPVINPATNTMYVVGATKENGVYFIRLHAINILTGAEQLNSPMVVQATVAGKGNGSSGGKLSFSPLWENQRVALDYFNGHVYFAFAAHGDLGPWHGWVFAYDAKTLAQTAVVCLSPDGFGNGVWASGAGMPIDNGGAGGRMFLATGNGTYATYPPLNASSEFGNSVVAFDLSNGGLKATDAFTSFNQAWLTSQDLDLGSGGILMLPDQQGTHPHILVQGGKQGRIVVLNRDSLGGYAAAGATSNTNALQDIYGETGALWSTPAYWNGNVYMWGSGNPAKMFSVNSGLLSRTPSSKSTITSASPGASFTVSSEGTQHGIAWAVRSDQYSTRGAEVLYAFDATDLSKLLYESDTNAARDSAGTATKFPVPVVTNGKVYVPARGQLDVYGLFDGQPIAAAPAISPKGGTFTAAQSVKLSTTTSSANIFYTLDGTVPSPGSTLYAGPISVSKITTIRAIAVASGFIQSPESSASFAFATPTPTFSPAAGTYTTSQSVSLSDTDANAGIYYTTDGTPPTASSRLYTVPIAVATSMTIKAIAIDPSLPNSNVATAAYVIQTGGSTINYGGGFNSSTGLSLVGSAKVTNNLLQMTTAGPSASQGSAWFSNPVSIGAFTTDFNFQLLSAKGGGFTFTIQNAGVSALGPGGSGLGYGASQPGGTGGIKRSVAIKFDIYNNDGEGTDSTGYYSNGASPTIPATSMSGFGVTLNSGHIFHAHITYDGTNLKMVLTDTSTSASFTTTSAINIPSIIGAGTAHVGFTGASSGGAGVTTDMLNWTLTGN